MKEIKKERITKSTYIEYEAVDGTIFDTHEECFKYEQTAECLLKSKFMKLAVCKPKNAWSFMGGYDDNDIIGIKPTCQADVDVIVQYYLIEHPHWMKDDYKGYRDRFISQMNNVLECNDVALFGINCENEVYYIESRMNIVDNLLNIDKDESSEDTKDTVQG